VNLQLVHQDDVATAIALAATGTAPPGAYNLAGDGEVSLSDVAKATGTRSIPVPHALASSASAVLARLPMVPAAAEWIHVARSCIVMDTQRAKNLLGWQPEYSSRATLAAMASIL
jgi:UDP-glucose 4-epimerase